MRCRKAKCFLLGVALLTAFDINVDSARAALFGADQKIEDLGNWTLWTGLYSQGCIVDHVYHSRLGHGATFTYSVRIGGESNGSYFLQVDLDTEMFGFESTGPDFFDSIQLPELMFSGNSYTATVDSARGSASLWVQLDKRAFRQLYSMRKLYYTDRGRQKLAIAVPSTRTALKRLDQCIRERS